MRPALRLLVAGAAGLLILGAQSAQSQDGVLDSRFANGGVTEEVIGASGFLSGMAQQRNGRIVVAGSSSVCYGSCPTTFTLARFKNGSLDQTFGDGGLVFTKLGAWAGATNVTVQPDGKILAIGYSEYDMVLVRYKPDGSLDPTFGSGGVTELNAATWAADLVLRDDGKVLVAATLDYPCGYFDSECDEAEVLRFLPNGTLDTTFGDHGVAKVPNEHARSAGLGLQRDGKIVLVGSDRLLISRLNEDGSFDGTFGRRGLVLTAPELRSGWSSSPAIQADGRIVVARGSVLMRYNPDGSRDTSFGSGGTASAPGTYANSVILDPKDRILVGGSGDGGYALARFGPDGRLDTGFGAGGINQTVIGGRDGDVAKLVLQPNGGILTAGNVGIDGGRRAWVVARYRSAATPVFQLRVEGSGAGNVRTVVNDYLLPGISCPPVCSAVLNPYTRLDVKAAPAKGSVFAGWRGSCDPSRDDATTCTVSGASAVALFEQCVVPRVKGLRLAVAQRKIKGAFCAVGHVGRLRSAAPKGRVIWQRPAPGTKLAAGSKVRLAISRGRR